MTRGSLANQWAYNFDDGGNFPFKNAILEVRLEGAIVPGKSINESL